MVSGQTKIPETDVLIVGAGFGAFTTLNRLRRAGLNVTIYEKGAQAGGIWYWNKYPGARVDSDTPIYQLFDEELWKDFTFTERYAGWKELNRYFDYVMKKWKVNDHVVYNKAVEDAEFDEERRQWLVECLDGSQIYARWFIPAIGFAAKKYIPKIPHMSDFHGELYHTATWPQHNVKLKGKRIAVIGSGASGIQCTQEAGPVAKQLTAYIRTPNLCLPMNQSNLDEKTEERRKADGEYQRAFDMTFHTFAGFEYTFITDKKTLEVSDEERKKTFDHCWYDMGGFAFWLATYEDVYSDQGANDKAYEYWRARVLERIPDSKKAAILAPEKAPHPFGTKRPSLEQNYYEVVSRDNVDVVSLAEDPIEKFTETGIQTKSGHKEFDMIILATGFDAVTGSLSQLNIKGSDGTTIKEHWADGLRTAQGMTMNKFPNMFFLYGPQAPTAFSNGPTCVQVQAIWLEKVMKDLIEKRVTRFEAKPESEVEWSKRVNDVWDDSLFPKAKSWYQGANIPGRKVEPLNWAGGMVDYIEALDNSIANDYQNYTYAK